MKKIVDLLRIGKDNARTRQQLSIYLNTSDRHVRQLIEDARDKGAIIISSSRNSGYWLPSDDEEIRSYIIECNHRIVKLMKQSESAKRYMANR